MGTVQDKAEKQKLIATGVGQEVFAKMEVCGVQAEVIGAAIIVSVKDGKIIASKWAITGNLIMVDISTHKLRGERGIVVTVDITDMFPGVA